MASFGWVEAVIFVKDGRITLIKRTLSNMYAYFLSLFSLSSSFANRIEKL
jgi:hypothetical protein